MTMRPVTPPPSPRRIQLDWVVVSLEGFRKWGRFAAFLAIAAGAVAGALYFLHEPAAKHAERLLRRASTVQEEVHREGISEGLQGEFDQASQVLVDARRDYERKEFPTCIARAEDALHRLELLSGLVNRELVGGGQIISIQGKVEMQRANQTHWETAREKQRLANGDFIKTAPGGAADILFSDGTVYRVGSDSLLEVHRGGRSGRDPTGGEVKVKVGQVNVYTSTNPSVVLTDAARAEVEQDSRVGVEVGGEGSTLVAAYAGRARVQTSSGQNMELSNQQAVRAGPEGRLGARRVVPDPPALEEPRANALVNLDANDKVELRWRPVVGGVAYDLEVSRSRLFAPSNLEVEAKNRSSTSAALHVLRPGTYYWRVAAVGGEKVHSEWSPPRAFRATSGPRVEEVADTTQPKLAVQRPTQMGHFVLVQGVTEPGVMVTVNGEVVEVAGDGTFKKAVVFGREGLNQIIIRAVDPAGNVSEHRETVVVEGD